MKKILTFAALFLTFGLFAEKEVFEISNDNSFNVVVNYWSANSYLMGKKPGGKIFKARGGRSGFCMRMTNTPKSAVYLFTRSLIPIDPAKDTIKCSFWIKGKGSFRIGFYVYRELGNKYLTTHNFQKVDVNSKEYKKYDFVFPCSKLNAKAKSVRLAMETTQAADLYFDDFTGVKESIVK